MKKTFPDYHYHRLLTLFQKLQSRLNRSFSSGRFRQLSHQKQYQLLQRLEKLKAQLARLENGLKYGSLAFAAIAGLSASPTETMAQFAPAGAEFRVNAFTTGRQANPATAMDSEGDFVMVWTSEGQNGDQEEVYGQRYNSSGLAQGTEFKVNTYTTNRQIYPVVAMDDDGDFVVAWQSVGQDGDNTGIYARRYNASGVAQGGEFRVNTYTTGAQTSVSVAMDSDGDFVIVWQSRSQASPIYGVYAKRYNAAGAALGAEYKVNTSASGTYPSIAMDDNGDFGIVYQSSDGHGYGIYGQRYNSSGVAQGNEFRVNTYTTNEQTEPSVAMDSDGDFIVSWSSLNQDGNIWGIYAQRYNAAGVAQGAEFRVNTYTTGIQYQSAAAMDAAGNAVISWGSIGQDGDGDGIYAQRYNAAGVAQGSEFKVNTYTTSYQAGPPAIAADNDNDFIIAWTSEGQDGNLSGVFAQRYEENLAPADIALSNTSVNENTMILSAIGTFSTADPDNNDTFTYELVSGAGSEDNSSFNIMIGKQLWLNDNINFEAKNSYSIRVRSTDFKGMSIEKVFTITIVDVNDAPNNITLSNNKIAENAAADTEIGTFTSTDEDAADTFTYALVAGTGDTDNASFAIVNDKLQIKISTDFEIKKTYNIRVRSTDQGGLSIEEPFTVTVTNVNEDPVTISLSNTTIAENITAHTAVGILTTTDVDASDTYTYSLVAGTGSEDNTSFSIVEDMLKIVVSPDFETRSSYSIRVRSTDQGGLSVEKELTITISDVVETAVAEKEFSASFQLYPNPARETVQLSLEGIVRVRILDLSGSVLKEELTDSKSVNIAGISPGIYLLEVTQNDKKGWKKLVIE